MSDADHMFKELGFKKLINKNNHIFYVKNDAHCIFGVRFKVDIMEYTLWCYDKEEKKIPLFYIDSYLHDAIHMKMLELEVIK